MNLLARATRLVLAGALLLAAPVVFAQTAAYTAGGAITVAGTGTVALALGPNGQVAVGVPNGPYVGAMQNIIGSTAPAQQEVFNYVSGANGSNLQAFGPALATVTCCGGSTYTTTSNSGYAYDPYQGSFVVAAIGANGVASNLNNIGGDEDEGNGGVGFTGVVTSSSGAIRYTGNGTLVSAINASNAVAGTLYANAGGYFSSPAYTGGAGLAYSQYVAPVGPPVPTGQTSVPIYEAATAPTLLNAYSAALGGIAVPISTPTVIATLGYGGVGTAINATGQVAGTDLTGTSESQDICNYYPGYGNYCYTSTTDNTEAFKTARSGGAVTYLGMTLGSTVGVSSTATAIDNAGAVGGYITLASGQTLGFISNPAAGNALAPVTAPGDSTDSTEVLDLNNDGQAIIEDTTTSTYWLDSGGTEYSMTSLFAPGALAGYTITGVAGLNDSGQILLDTTIDGGDPAILTSMTGSFAGTTGTSITSTAEYGTYEAQGGTTPSSKFFGGTDDSGGGSPGSGGSPVPEPSTIGLLGLGGLALVAGLFGRKRQQVLRA